MTITLNAIHKSAHRLQDNATARFQNRYCYFGGLDKAILAYADREYHSKDRYLRQCLRWADIGAKAFIVALVSSTLGLKTVSELAERVIKATLSMCWLRFAMLNVHMVFIGGAFMLGVCLTGLEWGMSYVDVGLCYAAGMLLTSVTSVRSQALYDEPLDCDQCQHQQDGEIFDQPMLENVAVKPLCEEVTVRNLYYI